jgi:hypothetical protein
MENTIKSSASFSRGWVVKKLPVLRKMWVDSLPKKSYVYFKFEAKKCLAKNGR